MARCVHVAGWPGGAMWGRVGHVAGCGPALPWPVDKCAEDALVRRPKYRKITHSWRHIYYYATLSSDALLRHALYISTTCYCCDVTTADAAVAAASSSSPSRCFLCHQMTSSLLRDCKRHSPPAPPCVTTSCHCITAASRLPHVTRRVSEGRNCTRVTRLPWPGWWTPVAWGGGGGVYSVIPKKVIPIFKTFQRIKIFWMRLFFSTHNSIVYQYLQALMKLRSHSITVNSYESGTKRKVAQELTITVYEPLLRKKR